MRGLGIDQALLRAKQGIVFAVRRVEADYLRPAVFDDVLSVQTVLADLSGARLVLDQAVLRGAQTLFTARVTLVCLTAAGTATRFPAALHTALTGAA